MNILVTLTQFIFGPIYLVLDLKVSPRFSDPWALEGPWPLQILPDSRVSLA